MLNKLINWLFPESDWEIVEVIHGEWTITNKYTGEKYYDTETSIYEIYYSKFKNDYKIVISGYHPKEHDKYVDAVKRLNELKNAK